MDVLNRVLSQIDELGRAGRDLDMLPLFEVALKEARLRSDEGLVARLLNDYGGVLRTTGNYAKGKEILLEALSLVLGISGAASQAYITTTLNLGTLYLDAAEYEAAEEMFRAALESAEKLQLENLLMASICNNLGVLYLKTNEYYKSYEFQKRALSILEQKENSRVKLAISYSNLAEVSTLLDYKQEAEQFIEKARHLLANSLGEQHPLYAMVVNNIATYLFRQGKAREAAVLLQKALPLVEKTYGSHSKAYKSIMANLQLVGQSDELGMKKAEVVPCPSSELGVQRRYREGSGLALGYRFYCDEVKPLLERKFPYLLSRMSIGLVGKGSECMDLDDEFSKDHDFETRVHCILTREDVKLYHSELDAAFSFLDGGNVYLVPTEDYLLKYTGGTKEPQSITEWRNIPEHFLATAVAGELFWDREVMFKVARAHLKGYYPKDLWLKHLAFHCVKLAQAGQYNFGRSLKRQDRVAAFLSLQEAFHHLMSIIFIMNQRYMPFYKWQYRVLERLPIEGKKTAAILYGILEGNPLEGNTEDILESLCQQIICWLQTQGLTGCNDSFLLPHGQEIQKHITDLTLRAESIWVK